MPDATTTVPADFTNLFLKGVEQVAELQKKSLETALQQNAEVIASYKKGAQAATTLPNVFDMAGKALESYIEAQKSMIDQIVQQTTALVESTKGGASSPQKVAEMFTKNIEQSIERTVEVQKKALELMVQQAELLPAQPVNPRRSTRCHSRGYGTRRLCSIPAWTLQEPEPSQIQSKPETELCNG